LIVLILKVEALSDWLHEPKRKKYLRVGFGVFLSLAVLWGMFIVPSTILIDSPSARVWVRVATTIFPWIAQIETHWGAAGQKALYLHSVFYLIVGFPTVLTNLGDWPHRIRDRKLMSDLPGEAFLWLIYALGFLLACVATYYLNYLQAENSHTFRDRAYVALFTSEFLSAFVAFAFAMLAWLAFMFLFLSLLYLIYSIDIKIKNLRGH